MSNAEVATLAVAILVALCTWTASAMSLTWWLSKKFRELEKLLYSELAVRDDENDRRFGHQLSRIQMLEIQTRGYTTHPE